jgi:hypothetical protein
MAACSANRTFGRRVFVETPQIQYEMVQNSFAKRARADKSRIVGSNNEGSAGFIKELVMIGKDGKWLQA